MIIVINYVTLNLNMLLDILWISSIPIEHFLLHLKHNQDLDQSSELKALVLTVFDSIFLNGITVSDINKAHCNLMSSAKGSGNMKVS